MAWRQVEMGRKALVSVFDDVEHARVAVEHLHLAGFPLDRIEVVTANVANECPEVKTPKDHATTSSALTSGAVRGLGIGMGAGAGFGVLATVLTAWPGAAIGAMIYAGLAGALVGGIGGVDKADLDDSVNLPTPAEYQALINAGHTLVVLNGSHDDAMQAEAIVKKLPLVASHLHRLHGHIFHEHSVPDNQS